MSMEKEKQVYQERLPQQRSVDLSTLLNNCPISKDHLRVVLFPQSSDIALISSTWPAQHDSNVQNKL